MYLDKQKTSRNIFYKLQTENAIDNYYKSFIESL